MLLARGHVKKSWDNQFQRRVLQELPSSVNGGKCLESSKIQLDCSNVLDWDYCVRSRRKTSEHSLSSIFSEWNDLSDNSESSSTYSSVSSAMSDDGVKEFTYSAEDLTWFLPYADYVSVFHRDQKESRFDSLLKSTWNSANENAVLRYQLDKLETRILPGKHGFVAQLNPKRAVERRPPESFSSISEPFDGSKFNFTKIKQDEILFSMRRKSVSPDSGRDEDSAVGDVDLVIANVSPLEHCHVLLVPKLHECLPQVITSEALRLAMHSILLSSSFSFRVGFNSLGAMASVNHLHLHAYYLNYNLPTESLLCQHLSGPCHIVGPFCGYPSHGFVFQYPSLDFRLYNTTANLPTTTAHHEELNRELDTFISNLTSLISRLHEAGIPHNLFFTRALPLKKDVSRQNMIVRCYVWTQDFFQGAKTEAAFNVALCELSGHLPVKTAEHFESLTESEVCGLLEEKTKDSFERAKEVAMNLFAK